MPKGAVMYRVSLLTLLAFAMFSLAVPGAEASDIEIAKVYRDYPGYIAAPTCENPRMTDASGQPVITDSGFAGTCPRAWTMTFSGGYQGFDNNLELKDGAVFGVGLGYNMTSNWAFETDLRYVPTETDLGLQQELDVDVWTISAGLLYNFLPGNRLVPYLQGGGGLIVYDLKDTDHNDEDYIGYWGGGLKYALTRCAALRLDLRHVIDYRSNTELEVHDDDKWQNHYVGTLGVTFQFGQ